jgi:predicted O-linked N-acetylglucosamine transferase (SPINDLY family)
VNDHKQEIASRVWKREELELPEDVFIFSSFNLPYKIDPIMFDCWMKILQRIPNSVLWLFDGGSRAKDNLKREAERRGIYSDRLIFAEKVLKAEHLSRLKLADLTLDPIIINGHTTTSDSLWTGVPVLTLQGSHFASRVSSSLLNAIGLSELIVHNLDAYEKLAVHLANHPPVLRKIKAKLSQNRLTEPLFDTLLFVNNLEVAYQKIWRIFMKGQAPMQIKVFED